jgi:serine phosphatase RsbU (regulator of sigma subunit)
MPNGRHLIMVGDVTGHGPGPAMVTAAVATAFRVMIESGVTDINRCLERLNHEVLRVAKTKYHMTMAVLELEDATGNWILHSAGSPPMLSLARNGKHRVHFCPGTPLGTENGFETGRIEGRLEQNERLLLYTDGIPEIILANGNVMGMRRFAQYYEQTRSQQLREAADAIVMHADAARGNSPQQDDWTFTMIEWA